MNASAPLNASAAASPEEQEAALFRQLLQFYNETKAFEAKVGIIIPSIFAVVIVVGLVGNLLVILVALNRQMRNSTNTLILGLTCSVSVTVTLQPLAYWSFKDLMFLTLCIPFTAIDYAFPVWLLPNWSCNVINYLQHSSAYFSVNGDGTDICRRHNMGAAQLHAAAAI